jgi:hypothetical protein
MSNIFWITLFFKNGLQKMRKKFRGVGDFAPHVENIWLQKCLKGPKTAIKTHVKYFKHPLLFYLGGQRFCTKRVGAHK